MNAKHAAAVTAADAEHFLRFARFAVSLGILGSMLAAPIGWILGTLAGLAF